LLLLHGANGSFADWPQHAHGELQRLAEAHGLIIVIPDGAKDGWYVPECPSPDLFGMTTRELNHGQQRFLSLLHEAKHNHDPLNWADHNLVMVLGRRPHRRRGASSR
jgi:hypothetical protein